MRFLFAALFLALFCSSIFAQQAQPDRWKGLVIDQSTPEDVIRILGQPSDDKINRLYSSGFDSTWLTKKISEKKFRQLEYKKTQGVDRVIFSFLDGTLATIDIDLSQQTPAAALERIYGIELTPKISGLTEALYPRDFERNQGRIYPKSYPTVYYLIGVSKTTFIAALIANNSLGTILKKSAGITDTGDFPGKVTVVRIVSRRLENRDGADALSADAPPVLSSEPTSAPTQTATPSQPKPTPTPEQKKTICFENGRKVPCP